MSDDILSLVPPKADARVPYGSDTNQFIDLRLPKTPGPHPLAICLHGGYWRSRYDLEYLGNLCAALTGHGIATANVEYRRVGNPGGGWPGTFADIRSAYQLAIQKASQYQFDPYRVVVIGHSAGGELALCLAGHEPGLTAVISLAGVVDLQRAYDLHLSNDAVVEFMGGTPAQVPDHYREADPMKLVIHKAQRIVYGSNDDIVPPELGKDYVVAKKKMHEDIQLVEISGVGHFELVDPRTKACKEVQKLIADSAKLTTA